MQTWPTTQTESMSQLGRVSQTKCFRLCGDNGGSAHVLICWTVRHVGVANATEPRAQAHHLWGGWLHVVLFKQTMRGREWGRERYLFLCNKIRLHSGLSNPSKLSRYCTFTPTRKTKTGLSVLNPIGTDYRERNKWGRSDSSLESSDMR